MSERLTTISPIDGRIYVERELADANAIDRALDTARRSQAAWQSLPLESRVAVLDAAVQAFVAKGGSIAEEITWQMGRPIGHSPGEIRGFEERARHMLGIAAQALAPIDPGVKAGFVRRIKRVPLGVVIRPTPRVPKSSATNSRRGRSL